MSFCPNCGGEMDEFGGLHMLDCPNADPRPPARYTVEEIRERLLGAIEAVARIPWDNDFPGAWDRGEDPESEEDRDPRPQARADVRSCIEAALDAAGFPSPREES